MGSYADYVLAYVRHRGQPPIPPDSLGLSWWDLATGVLVIFTVGAFVGFPAVLLLHLVLGPLAIGSGLVGLAHALVLIGIGFGVTLFLGAPAADYVLGIPREGVPV